MRYYTNFCAEAKAEAYPGEPKIVGACLALRAFQTQSVSMVEKLLTAVAHEHTVRFMTPPSEHPSLKLLMRSVRRNLPRLSSAVQPVEPTHLLQLNQHLEDGQAAANGATALDAHQNDLKYADQTI